MRPSVKYTTSKFACSILAYGFHSSLAEGMNHIHIMPTSASAREIVHLFLVFSVFLTCATQAQEQVRMTLLSRNHFQSEVDSQYECHLSEPDGAATVSSLRTNHTRACMYDFREDCDSSLLRDLNPDPPHPRRVSGDSNIDPSAYFVVDMINNGNNNSFGVFACNATKDGKVETIISTTRMRSDATIVPADDLFTKTVNINDTNVTISMRYIGSRDQPELRWRNNTQFRSPDMYNTGTFPLDGPAQLYHKGIYENFIAGRRNGTLHGLMILIIRACPANMWGPPACDGVCDSCYNGGICDEGTGRCVCPPGFMGRHCLTACGENRYGHVCEKKCSSGDQPDRCGGILFCLVHPYGCRCNTGWRGLDCSTVCDVNTYGASCLQSCHCASGQCNRYTGVCEGTDTSCEPGWTGDNCQECPNSRFGPDCSQECHCYKEYCNRETGLCNGKCLPRWIEQPQPFSCQTGLTHVTYTRGNPGEQLTLTCQATEGPMGDLSGLSFVLSRQEDVLNNTGIVDGLEESVDGQTQQKIFDVAATQEGDVFYCQLWRNVELLAVLNVSDAVFKLPVLSQAPDWLVTESTNTSITIRWRAWDPDRDSGDPPVVAYIPYYRRNSSDEWINGSSVPSSATLEFTAANLEEDTVYTFSVSVVREGKNGEGRLGPLVLAKTSPICQVPGQELLSQEECAIITEDIGEMSLLLILLLSLAILVLLIILLLVCVLCYRRRMKSGNREGQLFPNLSERTPATNPCHEDPTLSSTQDTIDLKPVGQVSTKDECSYNKMLDVSDEVISAGATKEEGTMEEEYGAVAKSTTVATLEFYKYDLTILEKEFKSLPRDKIHPWTVGQKERNKQKNRFKDMYTYDHSRVILEKLDGDEHSDYYNASFILNHRGEKAFIAAQGPNSITCCDFWRMIWGQNVSTVVMVTNLFKGKKERCKKYWPEEEGDSRQFDAIEVLWTKTQSFADCDLRTFQITRDGEQRDIQQFHFLSWSDSDVPEMTTPFIEFVKTTKILQGHRRIPVLVHCSAGIGKTGVYIALSCLMEVLQTEAYIDVFSFVEQMRQNRINMVQSVKEYDFLYRCLIEFYLTKNTEFSARDIATKHLEDKLSILQEEFTLLKRFDADGEKITAKMYEGLKPENAGRNRFHYIVPYDYCLPTLLSSSQSVNKDNYINAAVLNSFRRKNGLILTQSPLPDTIEDFWRMVYDWKCPLIVMLNQLDPNDESSIQYWPEEGTIECGYMSITFIMTKPKDYVIHHLFDVCHKSSKEVLSVHLVQLTDWPPEGSLQGVIESIREVEALEDEFKIAAPTVVHCIDGVGRSGVFATVKSEVERLEETGSVNVFSTAKQLRESNPNILQIWDNYFLCYQLINFKLQQEHQNFA